MTESLMQAQARLQPGTVIAGKYQLVRFVAAGGMGAIYLARQQPLGRHVALKVLRPELLHDAQIGHRFEDEARAISQLTHPNTITLFDYGVEPNGLTYLVVEWLDGCDLGKFIEQHRRLEPEVAAGLAAQIARSLEEAHHKGIVHRDLKPENVFVLDAESPRRRVKVLDFGIAKLLGSERPSVTKVGTVCGTPEYMSPEQGRGEELDGRSDLYSLSVILYAMLSGAPPFVGNMFTVVAQHQDTDFPPLPAELPEALTRILYRASRKQPEQRYQDAAEMATALEDFLLGVEQAARAPTRPRLPASPQRLKRGWLLAALVALAVVLVGAAALAFGAWGEQASSSTAKSPAAPAPSVTEPSQPPPSAQVDEELQGSEPVQPTPVAAEPEVDEASVVLADADRAYAEERLEDAAFLYARLLSLASAEQLHETARFRLATVQQQLGARDEALIQYQAYLAEYPAGARRQEVLAALEALQADELPDSKPKKKKKPYRRKVF